MADQLCARRLDRIFINANKKCRIALIFEPRPEAGINKGGLAGAGRSKQHNEAINYNVGQQYLCLALAPKENTGVIKTVEGKAFIGRVTHEAISVPLSREDCRIS